MAVSNSSACMKGYVAIVAACSVVRWRRSHVCVCRLSRVECQMLPRVVYVALKTLPAPMEPAPVAVPLTIAADAPMVRRVQLELFCAWRECEPMA
jgi:hypothetical protein